MIESFEGAIFFIGAVTGISIIGMIISIKMIRHFGSNRKTHVMGRFLWTFPLFVAFGLVAEAMIPGVILGFIGSVWLGIIDYRKHKDSTTTAETN